MKLLQIQSSDYWFKVIEMLQQNWALIEPAEAGCTVFFVSDTSGVFDELTFDTPAEAEVALARNGFRRFDDEPTAETFLAPPTPPFEARPHPNGKIYSSGRFWR